VHETFDTAQMIRCLLHSENLPRSPLVFDMIRKTASMAEWVVAIKSAAGRGNAFMGSFLSDCEKAFGQQPGAALRRSELYRRIQVLINGKPDHRIIAQPLVIRYRRKGIGKIPTVKIKRFCFGIVII